MNQLFLKTFVCFSQPTCVYVCVCPAMGRKVAPLLLGAVLADIPDRILHVPAGKLAQQAGNGAAVLPLPCTVSTSLLCTQDVFLH